MLSFDEVLATMLRDCALVSTTGKIVDLTEPRVNRQPRSVVSYRRLYAPQAQVGRGPRGGNALVHVVDTWLHHSERKLVQPGELEFPLSERDWWWLETVSKSRYASNMVGNRPDLQANPNFKPYVMTDADREHDKVVEQLNQRRH